jgi:hypothetical protein
MIKLDAKTRLLSDDAFIQEGCAPTDDLLMVACTVGDNYDDPDNELVLFSSEHLFRFGFVGEAVVSVDWHTDGTAFTLGESGTVIRFNWRDIASEKELKDSRELFENEQAVETGPMRRLRVIDGTPLCVGSFGQVYSVTANGFESFPFLKIYEDEVTIKDIAGGSLSDIVAVTQQGYAARYDGAQWIDLCLPTNMKLSGVTRLKDGGYAIVGSGGNLFIGKQDQWIHHHVDDSNRDYYGVAAHDTLIYMAHIGGVDVFDGEKIEEITYDGKPGLEFAFLSKGKACVWSFCGSTIGCITDRKWTTLLRK